jgi:hypothetical protein
MLPPIPIPIPIRKPSLLHDPNCQTPLCHSPKQIGELHCTAPCIAKHSNWECSRLAEKNARRRRKKKNPMRAPRPGSRQIPGLVSSLLGSLSFSDLSFPFLHTLHFLPPAGHP